MANLAQVSNVNTERGRVALGLLLLVSPLVRFLDRMSAFELDATDFQFKPEDSTTSVKNRALGGSYTAANMVPGSPLAAALAFHGDSLDVDRSHRADERLGLRLVDVYLDKRFRSKFRSWARGYEAKLTKGDPGVTTGDVTGLLTLLDGTKLPGFTTFTGVADAAEAASGSASSLDLSNEANWDAFVEAMILWLSQVDDPNGILLNPEFHARMYTIAQRKHILGETRDQFGNPVPTFGGVPFIKLLAGSITNTEPDNAGTPNTNTTSLVITSAGEGRVSVVTNSGLDFRDIGELEGKESERMTWEIRSQTKVEEERSILRVRNIKL